jgi:hypothetical protein
MFVVIVVDECFGDLSHIVLVSLERMRIPPFDTDRVSAENVFAPVDVHGEFLLQRSLRHIDLGNLVTVRRVDEYLPVDYVNVPTRVHGHAVTSSLPESKHTIRMQVGLNRNNAIPESPRIDKKHSLAFIDGRGVKPTFPRPHQNSNTATKAAISKPHRSSIRKAERGVDEDWKIAY